MKTKLFFIFAAVAVTALPAVADVRTAPYKGSTVCAMCHKKSNAAIVESYQKSPHSKSMQKAADQGAIVADFAGNTAFKKDQVAFVLGSGRHEQAYLDANYKVLPAVWDVKSKSWKPTAAVDGATQCVGCHSTGYNATTKVATQLGVGCEACHGPGGEHASGPKKASVVKPQTLTSQQKSMVCGQCHSVGKDPSGKSACPSNFRPGDDLSKCFVDAKPTGPGRNQQYSDFVNTKHAQNGVNCVTCHEPHDISNNPAQLKKPVTELCLGCHAKKITDLATHAPKAPAGATCATCHMPDGRHIFEKPKVN